MKNSFNVSMGMYLHYLLRVCFLYRKFINAVSFRCTFQGCGSLSVLDLSSFNVESECDRYVENDWISVDWKREK